jgi:hypothetical protein
MLLAIILAWIALSLPLGIIVGRIIDANSRPEPSKPRAGRRPAQP